MFGRGTKDMATVEKMPMLAEGHAKLTADLKRLKEERQQIVDAIEEAREHGDCSENADTHAARQGKGQVEPSIDEYEHRRARAKDRDPRESTAAKRCIEGP